METVHDKDNLELNLQVGGLSRDLAMSTMLGMTVLTPLPFPSTLATRRGILYLKRAEVCNRVRPFTGMRLFSPVEGVDHVPVDVESHVDGGVGVVVCPLDIPTSSSLLPILTANAMSNKRLLLKSWFSSLYLSGQK